MLGCGPRATLAPQAARGRTRPPRAAWSGGWAQTPALLKGTGGWVRVLCAAPALTPRGVLASSLLPFLLPFPRGSGWLFAHLPAQTGPSMQHLSEHVARDNRGICVLSEFSWLSPPIFILPLPPVPLQSPHPSVAGCCLTPLGDHAGTVAGDLVGLPWRGTGRGALWCWAWEARALAAEGCAGRRLQR